MNVRIAGNYSNSSGHRFNSVSGVGRTGHSPVIVSCPSGSWWGTSTAPPTSPVAVAVKVPRLRSIKMSSWLEVQPGSTASTRRNQWAGLGPHEHADDRERDGLGGDALDHDDHEARDDDEGDRR